MKTVFHCNLKASNDKLDTMNYIQCFYHHYSVMEALLFFWGKFSLYFRNNKILLKRSFAKLVSFNKNLGVFKLVGSVGFGHSPSQIKAQKA